MLYLTASYIYSFILLLIGSIFFISRTVISLYVVLCMWQIKFAEVSTHLKCPFSWHIFKLLEINLSCFFWKDNDARHYSHILLCLEQWGGCPYKANKSIGSKGFLTKGSHKTSLPL